MPFWTVLMVHKDYYTFGNNNYKGLEYEKK